MALTGLKKKVRKFSKKGFHAYMKRRKGVKHFLLAKEQRCCLDFPFGVSSGHCWFRRSKLTMKVVVLRKSMGEKLQ